MNWKTPTPIWRKNCAPDRCKVVFSPAIANDTIMIGTVMPGAPEAYRKPAVRALINRLIDGGYSVAVGTPLSRHRLMIDKYGARWVEVSAPDENGVQWGKE